MYIYHALINALSAHIIHIKYNTLYVHTIIIIMYIYHALINALSAHIIHIKYNTLYVPRGQSYQNDLRKALYRNAHTHTMTVAETGY